MTDGPAPGGVLVVDKPAGPTSHDVVARVRRLAGTRRVGHAGTLDPMATGVLVLGLDWSTRLLTFLSGHDKSYAATVRFGATTVTDDAEGEVVARQDARGLTDGAVAEAAARLTGDIEQVPSAVSAVKVEGRRAYARVRAGEEVELQPRWVRVDRFAVGPLRWGGGFDDPWCEADIEVDVSAGTYVRALARDLGAALGTGAHLTALRRRSSGPFTADQAVALDGPDGPLTSAALLARVLAPAAAARRFLPEVVVGDDVARAISHGKRLPARGTGRPEVAVLDDRGRLVAVIDDSGPALRTLAVVPTP
ncbi:MAG: tRNA pseudouridine(55) synthase TruB [Kineosporiaceae bacterium]